MLRHFLIFILTICILNVQGNEPLTKPLFLKVHYPSLAPVGKNIKEISSNTYAIVDSSANMVDISFKIIIPKEMLSDKWALSLTPYIITEEENGKLNKVVIKGWQFAKEQEEDYKKYNEFVTSTIDTSKYEEQYIDRKQLEHDIEHMHDTYWQFYYNEWENQVEYEIWKSKQSGRSQYFYPKDRISYAEQLLKQYLLRIEIQTGRYLNANMDTTGLYNKYITEYQNHIKKLPRFSVKNDYIKKVPSKFQYIYDSGRTLDDITNAMLQLLEERDSLLMNLPVFDYQKIAENEKRILLKDKSFDKIVKFPKDRSAITDTIIYNLDKNYEYIYTYQHPITTKETETIQIKLDCKIIALDGSGYNTSAHSLLTFILNYVENNTDLNNRIPESEELKNDTTSFPIINTSQTEEVVKRLIQNMEKLSSDSIM